MPNIKFYVDENKRLKDGSLSIRASIAISNHNISKIIEKVQANDWNFLKQRVGNPEIKKHDKRKDEINKFLDDYQAKANSYFNSCKLNDISLTEKVIKDFLNGNVFVKSQNNNINTVLKQYIVFKKQTVSPKTLKKLDVVQNFLINYQEYIKVNLTFNDIDETLLISLREYATNVLDHQRNTVFSNFQDIKSFLRWAKVRKYYSGFAHENFKTPSNTKLHLSLSFDELKTLYFYPFETKRLDRIRDVFCLGCLTGLRRQDLISLRREHIQGRFINITLKKSPLPVIIPIVDAAQRIIDKYDNPDLLFRKISHSNYLKYLTDCCKLAGLTINTLQIRFIGNSRFDKYLPKNELITGHTSRKTFMSLSFELGVPEITITSITGHQDGKKVIHGYLKVDGPTKLKQLDKAWRVLYQFPGQENQDDVDLTDKEKELKKRIEELEKFIASNNLSQTSSRTE